MIPAQVWTDGSCVYADPKAAAASGFGGWAAVVERGGYRWERRGRADRTTATRMELRAIVEGLRSLPDAVAATVHVDCTIALVVHEKWRRGDARAEARRDGGVWAELIDQLERVDVSFHLLLRGRRGDQHRRAHTMAGEESRALAAGLDWPHLLADRRRRSRKLSGPPPPSPAWRELAQLARDLTADRAAR